MEAAFADSCALAGRRLLSPTLTLPITVTGLDPTCGDRSLQQISATQAASLGDCFEATAPRQRQPGALWGNASSQFKGAGNHAGVFTFG